jgi:hypothetical protein
MNAARPKNLRYRTSAKAAIVPSTIEADAVISAIFSEATKPLISSASCRISAYQCSEKPPHTVTIFDSLNENTISVAIGMYRNA